MFAVKLASLVERCECAMNEQKFPILTSEEDYCGVTDKGRNRPTRELE